MDGALRMRTETSRGEALPRWVQDKAGLPGPEKAGDGQSGSTGTACVKYPCVPGG